MTIGKFLSCCSKHAVNLSFCTPCLSKVKAKASAFSRYWPCCNHASKSGLGNALKSPRNISLCSDPVRHPFPLFLYLYMYIIFLLCSTQNALPLGILAINKRLEDANDLVQRSQPGLELLIKLLWWGVLADLLVEISTLWAVAHGSGEDLLDDEVVVGLKGLAVGVGEGGGELLCRGLGVGAEGLGHKVKATGGWLVRKCED